MCKSQAEGGQRCASHARAAVEHARLVATHRPHPDHLAALIDREIEYASTPEGLAQAIANAEIGAEFPGELGAEMWTKVASGGQLLRERNQMVGAATKAALARGDAFHRDLQDKVGDLDRVPDTVRDPAKLASYLADRDMTASFYLSRAREWDEERTTIHELQQRLAAVSVDKSASFASAVPRTEEEARQWAEFLAQEDQSCIDLAAKEAAIGANINGLLTRLGKDPVDVSNGPRDGRDRGFVGYWSSPDGRTDLNRVFVVTGSPYPHGRVDATCYSPDYASNSPERHRVGTDGRTYYGRPAGDPALDSRVEADVDPARLVPASPEHQANLRGQTNVAYDGNFEFAWGRTPRDTAMQRFDDFRLANAHRMGNPYKGTPEPANMPEAKAKAKGFRRFFG